MKRRQRKPILDINGEQADSPRRRWHNKYEQIVVDHPEQNGALNNPLTNLVGQYDSDSESEEKQTSSNILNDKVNDFLKEIQAINPEKVLNVTQPAHTDVSLKGCQGYVPQQKSAVPSSAWQECFDESTGYPYYWHMETNEVTWDLPDELRILRNISQQESVMHNPYLSHWSNPSTKTYPQPQNNIPEGMIPKEVVARNRNRQVENQKKQLEVQEKSINSKPPYLQDDDSDDGKIEMITSFGNDDTDTDESESDESVNKQSEKSQSYKTQSRTHSAATSPKTVPVEIGPSLPDGMIPMIHGPLNIDEAAKNASDYENGNGKKHITLSAVENVSSNGEEEHILQRLKNQEKFIQSQGSSGSQLAERAESPKNKTSSNSVRNKDDDFTKLSMKVSLVPGYEDDSDIEEESPQKRAETKPLFPIADYHENESASSLQSSVSEGKKVEINQTDTEIIRPLEGSDIIKEKENLDKLPESQDSETGILSKNENEQNKGEQDALKANKFLEDIETPTKAFLRKKRIAFDVIPNKTKSTEHSDSCVNKPETSVSYSSTFENTEKLGLGFQKDDDNTCDSSTVAKPAKDTSNAVPKKGISFVKGETMNPQVEESAKSVVQMEAEKVQFKALIDTTMEKLKFLSEGSQPASAVQVMAIQLQTLFGAWETGDLKEKYFRNWLTNTSCELGRLEQTAAPPGWDCQWDRSHKRYYYRNVTSGEAQWTYPETDIVGGTEEMELCTTPPPEQEEASVIEMNVPSTESTTPCTREDNQSTSSLEKQEKNRLETDAKEPAVPPPPQISSPSPPPPPRICGDDMKRGKKRKANETDKISDSKNEKLDKDVVTAQPTVHVQPSSQGLSTSQSPKTTNPPNSEPLPPGVDSSDISYSLPTSAIESTVLYTAGSQQTNPIYAATLGNAAVPLLAHHTALMQGQLMHYSTYHPLHNQMIMATANRLAEQDALQFMVADYSRLYENNQVIAKPPVKTQRESIGSAIDSFYNDIASLEQNNKTENETERPDSRSTETVPFSAVQVQQTDVEKSPVPADAGNKEKKKKKTKMGISKKQKEVSSMVAKWQRAQKNFVD